MPVRFQKSLEQRPQVQPAKTFPETWWTCCRGMSRGRSASLAQVKAGSGLKDAVQRNKAVKMADKQQRRAGKAARRGEGDRHIPDFKPKHLFSGKRPKGSTDRR